MPWYICGLNCLPGLLSLVADLFIITTNLSILSPSSSLMSNDTFLLWLSLMLMNGVDKDCPDNCLSNFSFVNILLAVSTACLRSSMGNNIQYNFVGSVFWTLPELVFLHNLNEWLLVQCGWHMHLWFMHFCQN